MASHMVKSHGDKVEWPIEVFSNKNVRVECDLAQQVEHVLSLH